MNTDMFTAVRKIEWARKHEAEAAKQDAEAAKYEAKHEAEAAKHEVKAAKREAEAAKLDTYNLPAEAAKEREAAAKERADAARDRADARVDPNAAKEREAAAKARAQAAKDRNAARAALPGRGKPVVVREYKNAEDFQQEADLYTEFGYEIQTQSGNGGHLNVGRTAIPALMTGGLSLFLGGSRSKGKTMVTYVIAPQPSTPQMFQQVSYPIASPQQGAVRFCGACGQPVSASAQFCAACGAKVQQ